jgi:hypothetical protein
MNKENKKEKYNNTRWNYSKPSYCLDHLVSLDLLKTPARTQTWKTRIYKVAMPLGCQEKLHQEDNHKISRADPLMEQVPTATHTAYKAYCLPHNTHTLESHQMKPALVSTKEVPVQWYK